MIRRPPRSTPLYSSAASDVYKRQHILRLIKHSNYQGIATFDEGKASMEGVHERVDFPATERILELMQEGLSPEEVIMRGFSFEKVTEALKYGA